MLGYYVLFEQKQSYANHAHDSNMVIFALFEHSGPNIDWLRIFLYRPKRLFVL